VPKDTEPPYFQFYPDDFASDGKVEAMSTEEVGAYMLLLCKAWREKPAGSIPDDDRVLARWTRLSTVRWTACRPAVLAAFELAADGRFYQKRLRREHDKFRAFQRKRAESAKTAAEARWAAERMRDASGSHTDALRQNAISSSPSPSYSNTGRARKRGAGGKRPTRESLEKKVRAAISNGNGDHQ
jgi:uncharacterized protein YdaU (DUF1376 family)